MSEESLKLYGVCLERLKYQIETARQRVGETAKGRIVLEGYQTGDMEEIIDLLELYDIEDRKPETLEHKLDDVAKDVSLLVRETVEFDYDDNGCLCLYWRMS